MDIDIFALPVPDWGLECPTCRYPLKGLPRHRCPECGAAFDMRELVQPWTRVREPRFTGRELPVPDFGLSCPACSGPLAGAAEFACPLCGRPFELEAWRPTSEWFVLDRGLAGPLSIPGIESLLAAEHVPFFQLNEQSLAEMYGGRGSLADRLRVPTEFYFDLLWLVRRTCLDMAAQRARPRPDWRCQGCGEDNPGHFDVCWSCEAPRGG